MLRATGNPPPSRHRRKKANERPEPGHERCQHQWKIARETPPGILRGAATYHFNCFCLVTMRWMKIEVPQFYFWFGDASCGRGKVDYGEIEPPKPDVVINEV